MVGHLSTPIRSIGQTAQGIREALQLPELDNEPYEFWKSVSISLTGTYEESTAAGIAEALIHGTYDRDWDPEECVDEETGLPSVAAYEEILEIIQMHKKGLPDEGNRNRAEEIIQEDEKEEAGSDALASMSQDIDFQTMDTPIRELLTQIHKGELIISPEWQRSFVWKAKRKKRFIESILIGLPIPSILTWHDSESGKEYIIDGRQRLETLLRFTSTKEELQKLGIVDKPFKTFTAKEPLFAEGAPLEAVANKPFSKFKEIPEGTNSNWETRFYRRSFHKIMFKELTRGQLYQVFERYNTGGVTLQAQEIRNAIYQGSSLHKHLWNLAREYSDPRPEPDSDVDRIAENLRSLMDSKVDRYGVYSLIGRVMAFTYFHYGKETSRGYQRNYTATVASATVDFMNDHERLDWDEIRAKWIRMYDKTLEWYTIDLGLVSRMPTKVSFHAFLATVQLATTDHLLQLIDVKKITEDRVKQAIQSEWRDFAFNDPEINPEKPMGIAHANQKQNSTHFWRAQRDWLDLLRDRVGLREGDPA